MKNILLVIVAVVAALFLQNTFFHKDTASVAKKETAFDRIVRTGEIRCGYAVSPPYLYIEPNTKSLHGINYDIIEAIAKNLDLKVNWVEETGWGNYIESMNAGRLDVMCASVWANGPRTKNSTLTKPTAYSVLYVVAKAGDHRFDDNLDKMNDPSVHIAVVENDVSHSIAKESYPKATFDLLPPSSDWVMPVMDVMTGKADVAFCDSGLFQDFDSKNPGQVALVKGPPSRVYGETLSVPLGDHDLENMINSSLTTLVNSGVIKSILSQYKGDYYPPAPEFGVR